MLILDQIAQLAANLRRPLAPGAVGRPGRPGPPGKQGEGGSVGHPGALGRQVIEDCREISEILVLEVRHGTFY